jgi:hypothetical protein
MNKETFDAFREFAVDGERNRADQLDNLNAEEAGLFNFLKARIKDNRLEQEKISQAYVDVALINAVITDKGN